MVERARRRRRLAGAELGICELLRADRAADHRGEKHEDEPPRDGHGAVSSAPMPRSRGDPTALSVFVITAIDAHLNPPFESNCD
jgi:hypothetical protein